MLKHSDIWKGIDKLAEECGLSPSGLAKKAGLDSTSFNKSKRGHKGRLRWPSTESISKILDATGRSMAEFVAIMGGEGAGEHLQKIPVIGCAQAGRSGYFDDAGYPTGKGWDELSFPATGDPNAYALEISGDSMEPLYRDGDIIVVSPGAQMRKGDRVVIKTRGGEVMAKQLLRHGSSKIELLSLNHEHKDIILDPKDVQWMARIIWVSQ